MQNSKIGNLLFITFWLVYVLTAVGTLAMLFLGFGTVQASERGTLINTFLVESAVAVFALFYSVFGLKKGSISSKSDQDTIEKIKSLEKEVIEKSETIKELNDELDAIQNDDTTIDYGWKYRDSIIALCSTHSNKAIPDLIKDLGLDGDESKEEKKELLTEIGRLKKRGILINDNALHASSVKLSQNT